MASPYFSRRSVVVLTGAGISAESGLQTFRGSGGLWEGYPVEDVATPEAWERDPALVLEFYNQRRRAVANAKPNAAHHALAQLEERFNVTIITQNIDDLHERAGSTKVLHLHGEIQRSQSTARPEYVYPIEGTELSLGERCEFGSQLRPAIVWFGEPVPKMDEAIQLVRRAEMLIVCGTSLVVYPAASLVHFVPKGTAIVVIDPERPQIDITGDVRFVQESASAGVPRVVEELLEF